MCSLFIIKFARKHLLNFEYEINDQPIAEDGQQPIEVHALNPSNEWIHMLQFKILHCEWWILIVLFHFSTTENLEGPNIQDGPRHEHDVHDVATSSKKHLCNVFFNEKLVIIIT